MAAELILYRNLEGIAASEEHLRQLEIGPDTDIVMALPGEHRDINLPSKQTGGLDQKVHLYVDQDNTATRVLYRYKDEAGEIKEREIKLADSQEWLPIPADHKEFSWVLVRHNRHPKMSIGKRYG